MTTEETKTLMLLDREIEEHPQNMPQARLCRYRELLTKHIAAESFLQNSTASSHETGFGDV